MDLFYLFSDILHLAASTENNPVVRFCKHGNELSGSMKGGYFLDQLSEYQLLKMNSAAWSLGFPFLKKQSFDILEVSVVNLNIQWKFPSFFHLFSGLFMNNSME